MSTSKIPLWDGSTIECVNCNTTYGVFEQHECRPQARCQSCFTPAKLYDALNTHLCVKCLAIIAKSILDSGLADSIIAQERLRLARLAERIINSHVAKDSHTINRWSGDLIEDIFREFNKEESWAID